VKLLNPTEEHGGQLGSILFRELGDGRGVWVYPMLYTFKLVIGPLNAGWHNGGWCYKDLPSVVVAFVVWNPVTEPEPDGWVRHPPSGRRRFPDGDPTTEEIRE
jgi:hypothetical protein